MQKEQDFDVSEEREMLARGLKEKVDFSRITLNNQETREKETQQQEKKRLSRSSPAHVSQHKTVLASRNFSSKSRPFSLSPNAFSSVQMPQEREIQAVRLH